MTKSETMVERVARALCAHDDYDPDGPGIKGGTAEFMWQHYRGAARAAIEAMRELNPSIIQAVLDTNRRHPEPRPLPVSEEFEAVQFAFGAGIDAMLSEEGE